MVLRARDLLDLWEGSLGSYVWRDPISSWILISSKSLLSSIAVTFAQKLSGKDLKIFLTILASLIFSPRLSLAITISLSFP